MFKKTYGVLKHSEKYPVNIAAFFDTEHSARIYALAYASDNPGLRATVFIVRWHYQVCNNIDSFEHAYD